MYPCVDGTTTVDRTGPFAVAGRRIHLVGIGGTGMRGAARMLADLGAVVSGSDLQPFDGMGELVASNVRVAIGHDAGHLSPDVDLVVISAAIPSTNPELIAARERGLDVLKYAEVLGLLMSHRRGIAVAGTHGKSTTTAMTAFLLRQSGLDPSFVVGARSAQLGGSSRVGSGPHFVVEACEFDRSFLHLRPHAAVILNVEPDHLDCFGDFAGVVEAFAQFTRRVHPDGMLLLPAKDAWSGGGVDPTAAAVQTFGIDEPADWRAVNLKNDRGRFAFDVLYGDTRLIATRLVIPGRHNVANALAALALAYHAGAEPERLGEALTGFTGIGRRLDWRGEGHGIQVVDDYAHHPTEIRVTLDAARQRYQPKRLWVVFQPHQYARTRFFLEDFAASFGQADEIVIPDVYGAREEDRAIEPIGSEQLVDRIRANGGRVRYLASLRDAAEHVAQHVTQGDLIITMGAGDIWKVADELVERIR